jgi:PiT family inorganic phosphate transporter
MAVSLILVVIVIFIALIFDFTNGFHDSANAIATVVSTKVLTPRKAVMFAAFFNFVAALSVGLVAAIIPAQRAIKIRIADGLRRIG